MCGSCGQGTENYREWEIKCIACAKIEIWDLLVSAVGYEWMNEWMELPPTCTVMSRNFQFCSFANEWAGLPFFSFMKCIQRELSSSAH